MCIRWCCKSCPDNKVTRLNHRWARERCNDYFIVRSMNQSARDCPKGPAWELRRAFHRHPYRGSQRCGNCIKIARQSFKCVQMARQKANAVIGELPDYAGALYLGELEIPDNFHDNAQHLLDLPGKVDAMISNWESFNSENGHLPSYELEREWATRFTGFNGLPPLELASIFERQQIRGDDSDRSTVSAEEVCRSPHQQIFHHPESPNTYQGNGISPSVLQHVRYDANSSIKRANSTTVGQEASPSARQHDQDALCPNTAKRNDTPIGNALQNALYQICYDISADTDKRIVTTLEAKEYLRDPYRDFFYSHSKLTMCTAPFGRTRPWDL